MKKFSIDTNAVLRFLLSDDQKQAELVKNLFEEAQQNKVNVMICIPVFIEAVFVLVKGYNMSKSLIVEKLIGITNLPFLTIEYREVVQRALELYEDHQVSFVDLLLLARAQYDDYMLWTFDKKLKQLAEIQSHGI